MLQTTDRVKFWSYILSEDGTPLQDVEVRIYLQDNPTVEANIFIVPSGGVYTTSSVTDLKTDNNGYFEVWFANEWEDGGHLPDQKFRLEWYRAGIAPGVVEFIDPWSNAFAVDESQSSGNDAFTRNKLISNFQGKKWQDHLESSPNEATPHDLTPVSFALSAVDTVYNKVVSNELFNDIFTTSNSASAVSLSGSVDEYQETVSAWNPSGGEFEAKITHNLGTEDVSVQVVNINNFKIVPADIIVLDADGVRVIVAIDGTYYINVQGG
jgi:hypothetical protein